MAKRRSDIPAERLDLLNRGEVSASTLVENLAMDLRVLMGRAFPELADAADILDSALPFVQRMERGGALIWSHLGESGLERALSHPSDTVRGWATYAVRAIPDLSLDQRLIRIRPLADDPHFGVREWAWLAVRPMIAAEVVEAIALLTPWTASPSPYLRRFASEATRPRGVWCAHIPALKDAPEMALPLLSPLKSDSEGYVRDSVANWLNDAAKSRPDWVRTLCDHWRRESPTRETTSLVKRALRSLIVPAPATVCPSPAPGSSGRSGSTH